MGILIGLTIFGCSYLVPKVSKPPSFKSLSNLKKVLVGNMFKNMADYEELTPGVISQVEQMKWRADS